MEIRRKIINSLPWEVEGLHASLGAFVFARAAQETLRATLLTLTFSFGAGDETGVGAPAKTTICIRHGFPRTEARNAKQRYGILMICKIINVIHFTIYWNTAIEK